MTPIQWHLYTVDLKPRIGTKPGKQRPALVIQPSEFAVAGLDSSVILPLTSQLIAGNAWPLRVRVDAGVCGLTKASDVMTDQILTWSHEFFVKDLGSLPAHYVEQVQRALKEFLNL